MHGFVKKGLLVSLAAGSLMAGGAGVASAADSATANGAAAGSEGLGSGNVAQGAADVPIQVCGDTAGAGTAHDSAVANGCLTENNRAAIDAATRNDPGAISGDAVGAALDAPVQGCGLTAGALSAASGTAANTCVDKHTSATATAATMDDPGAVSGDVVQLAANAPLQLCGDSVTVIGYGSDATANSCSNG
jgi:hypothetical protein